MAISRNNLSMKLKGRVGAFSYYLSTGGRQIARVANNASNYGDTASRTESQQLVRARWGNVINFYKPLEYILKKAFETKKTNQSDYNKFVSVNFPLSSIYLKKDQYAQGGCVAENYYISQGSLPSIDVVGINNGYKTSIEIGSIQPGETTTIGALSTKIIELNSNILEGDQITLIRIYNYEDEDLIPRIEVDAVEITMDPNSQVPLGAVDKKNVIASLSDYLSIDADDNFYSAACILSRLNNGKLLVSSQQMATKNNPIFTQYTGSKAMYESLLSYKVTENAYLDPGGPDQPNPNKTPLEITITARAIPESKSKFVMGVPGKAPSERNSFTQPKGSGFFVSIYNVDDPDFIGWSTGDTDPAITITPEESAELIAFFRTATASEVQQVPQRQVKVTKKNN